VVGGGEVAERKVVGLLQAQALVLVVSPDLTAALKEMADKGEVQWIMRHFEPGDLEGAWLVIASTDDPVVQKAVYAEAQRRRIFCNTVDLPALCSFIVPSSVRRGDLCVAISTGGKSPALARRLRREFEQVLGPWYSDYVSFLGDLRGMVLSACDEPDARRRLCMALAAPEVMTWMEEGDWDRLESWAVSLCGEGACSVVDRYRKAVGQEEIDPVAPAAFSS